MADSEQRPLLRWSLKLKAYFREYPEDLVPVVCVAVLIACLLTMWLRGADMVELKNFEVNALTVIPQLEILLMLLIMTWNGTVNWAFVAHHAWNNLGLIAGFFWASVVWSAPCLPKSYLELPMLG